MKKIYLFAGLWVALVSVKAQQVATFDNVELEPDSYWNGSDGSGGITSGDFYFPNDFNTDWASWSGFSVSNLRDSTTPGYENQYSAITASGANQSENYAVVYASGDLKLEFDNPLELTGFYATNSTYAYFSLKDGDGFTKKFGGVQGTDPDYFKLIVTGTDIYGNETDPVEFFLADFTAENSGGDYIVNAWEWVDLSGLGVVSAIRLRLESTDIGTWGMNTPAYFCIDNFNGISPEIPGVIAEADFEDLDLEAEKFYNGSDGAGNFTSGGFIFPNDYNPDWGSWSGFAASAVTDNQTAGWDNQYSAIPGLGALRTQTYAVSYTSGVSEVNFEKSELSGFYITNSTYTYWSMFNGDDYSKKFGGNNGTDPDWFKVTITGVSETGDTTGTIDFYLADFRPENNNDDYIIDDWEWVDLSGLGEISKLHFTLSSSDVGTWGINTPAYFCMDQLNHRDLPPVVKNPIATISESTYPDNVYYVQLDSVFTDPDNSDSEIVVALEYIDNPDLLTGTIVAGEEGEMLLSLNILPGATGSAEMTISATSNGKTVYHTFEMIVSMPVSAPLITESGIKIYPNPVNSDFYVELPANAERILLYDPSGKIITEKPVFGGDKIQFSQLQASPAGIYFLKVKTKEGIFSQKIVKL